MNISNLPTTRTSLTAKSKSGQVTVPQGDQLTPGTSNGKPVFQLPNPPLNMPQTLLNLMNEAPKPSSGDAFVTMYNKYVSGMTPELFKFMRENNLLPEELANPVTDPQQQLIQQMNQINQTILGADPSSDLTTLPASSYALYDALVKSPINDAKALQLLEDAYTKSNSFQQQLNQMLDQML